MADHVCESPARCWADPDCPTYSSRGATGQPLSTDPNFRPEGEHVNCAHDPAGADGNPFAATICSPSGVGPEISSHPDCECPGGPLRRIIDHAGPCPLHGAVTGSDA